ncbi:MAG: UDP-N-acetylmuramoyl-tripeptide--D-alanyl-D-alanine ligase, partial [Phycisphaerales bacterium]|nr:UDP-N-acetylmuramoyl-tripeptide--D-alanyl-D-alanine ligase [Phycisphaerales bacterium]
MKAWDIEEIRRAVKGKWLHTPIPRTSAWKFSGRIATDSRTAAAGDLFFTLVGERHDAHAFVEHVIERGVAGIIVHKKQSEEIVQRAQEKGAAMLLVDDTIAALNRLAAAYRENMRAKVIAVGGSNGKTTTKKIIHTLLSEKFGVGGGIASPKSFNNNIGMPLTLLAVDAGHDYVVLEIGTNAPGEIAALGAVCRPDVAVITNIGLEHLEKLGDLEGVAKEEAAIAAYIAEGGTIILPENKMLMDCLKGAAAQKIVVRKEPQALGREGGQSLGFSLTNVAETMHGVIFSVNGRGMLRLPLLGEHNAMNALMAIAVARRMGLSDEQIASGLGKVKAAEGRLEPLTIGTFSIIHDAYNANPSSMEVALRTFAKLASPKDRAGEEAPAGAEAFSPRQAAGGGGAPPRGAPPPPTNAGPPGGAKAHH